MNTDDRDIESSNPSKNFKVGDVDQLSGFFTPVWESKRRIRSEPPAPPSSKGPPSSHAPSQRGSHPPSAPEAASADERVPGKASKGIPRPRSAAAASKAPARGGSGRTPTPAPPPASERAGASDEAGAALAPLPAEVAAVFNAPTSINEGTFNEGTSNEGRADQSSLAPAPVAGAELGTPDPTDAKRPSAAARALRDAGPDLPPAAFLDAEPEFRLPPAPAIPRPARTDRPAAQFHAQRAAHAASRVHEQFKARLQAEAAELEENRLDIDPDTHRDALQALEPSAYDPFPISLVRRMRRTIRLSTPVPDEIRSLISKYDRG
jgi:hypothetical protein